jgi:hypothetical protein
VCAYLKQIVNQKTVLKMAKKLSSSPALVFEYRAAALQQILASNPDKVVFTISVEAVEAKTGGTVGALRISAKGEKFKASKRTGGTLTRELSRTLTDADPRPPGVGA